MSEIYQPAEDSYFFGEFLKKYLSENSVNSYLDMGTGSGILSETVVEFLDKEKALAVDINSDVVEFVKSKGLNVVLSDLFEKVEGKFDLITFNAPYLPLDEREPEDSRIATTGGKLGDEISVRFLEEAKNYLNEGGKIFLLVSSLTPMDKIEKFRPKEVSRKKIDFEDLIIYEIS